MKKRGWILLLICLGGVLSLKGQIKRVTLEQLLVANKTHQLQEEQKQLLQQMGESLKSVLWHSYIPQTTFNGQVTYQSDVPNLALELPAVPSMPPVSIDLPEVAKLQYQAALQLTQLLWDGGRTAAGVRQVDATSASQLAELDIAIHKSKEALLDLYFALLMAEGQMDLLETELGEIERQRERVSQALGEGVASAQELDLVKLEALKARQQYGELARSRKTLVASLAILTGLELSEEVEFVVPPPPLLPSPATSESRLSPMRPEYRLIASKVAEADASWGVFKAGLMPTVALFARGGYGRPGLNLFSPEPDLFGIYGITVKWDFGKLYDLSDRRKVMTHSKQIEHLQKEAFDLEYSTKETELKGDIERYHHLLGEDEAIIEIYQGLLDRATVELSEGTNTLFHQLQRQAELRVAKQQSILHKLQYLRACWRLQSHRGVL